MGDYLLHFFREEVRLVRVALHAPLSPYTCRRTSRVLIQTPDNTRLERQIPGLDGAA